jgi:hypothetical protein
MCIYRNIVYMYKHNIYHVYAWLVICTLLNIY